MSNPLEPDPCHLQEQKESEASFGAMHESNIIDEDYINWTNMWTHIRMSPIEGSRTGGAGTGGNNSAVGHAAATYTNQSSYCGIRIKGTPQEIEDIKSGLEAATGSCIDLDDNGYISKVNQIDNSKAQLFNRLDFMVQSADYLEKQITIQFSHGSGEFDPTELRWETGEYSYEWQYALGFWPQRVKTPILFTFPIMQINTDFGLGTYHTVDDKWGISPTDYSGRETLPSILAHEVLGHAFDYFLDIYDPNYMKPNHVMLEMRAVYIENIYHQAVGEPYRTCYWCNFIHWEMQVELW